MGLFSKIKQSLIKTKNQIGYQLNKLFTGGVLNDKFYEELEDILISADVGSITTDSILEELKSRVDKKLITSPSACKKELKEVLHELIDYEIEEYTYPLIIMIAGVNGVGKTTSIGKLAHYFKSKGKSVMVVAGDTFRAAASEQLGVWANRANVKIIKQCEGADAAAVVFDAIKSAKSKGTEVVLIDTAGRMHNKQNLIEELKKINRVVERGYEEAQRLNYIVLDAVTGQNAVSQVRIFNEAIDIDGIILTKLDGTAKGGVVFAIENENEIPVIFAGVGEGMEDFIEFDSELFVNEIIDA